jgi:hypothetical protein
MQRQERTRIVVRQRATAILACLGLVAAFSARPAHGQWFGYGRNAQHTALTPGPSQRPLSIRWQTPIDLDPQYSGDELLIHYGSPAITAANNIIVPIKTGASGGFSIKGINATTGAPIWTMTTDYVLPPHNWTPPMGVTLTSDGTAVVVAGAGGTIWVRNSPNSAQGKTTRLAFFGSKFYNQNPNAYNSAIQICTPVTCDGSDNLYFGYLSTGQSLPGYPRGIPSGLARVDLSGDGTFVAASALAGDSNIQKVVYNCAPAVSVDGSRVYVSVNQASYGYGYLCMAAAQNLRPQRSIMLRDPRNGQAASLPDDGTAAPTIGLDGDVFYGVLEANFPSNHARGWMLHYNATLTTTKIPGAFGWDDSASVVPAAVVPSYRGHSSYLVLTKYNNYANGGIGGDGLNKVAILDPGTSMVDPISGAKVMNEVLTIAGPTPNSELPGVTEWCINSAAVDVANKCAIVNSEDGHVYRWNFTTNTLSAGLKLAPATGEAYTSTLIGPDGAVYAMNDAKLFCCDAKGFTPTAQPGPTTRPGPTIRPGSRSRAGMGLIFFGQGPGPITPLFQGVVALTGIFSALALHLGIRSSSRRRRSSGSFLSA